MECSTQTGKINYHRVINAAQHKRISAIVSCYDTHITRFRYFLKDCPYVNDVEKVQFLETFVNKRLFGKEIEKQEFTLFLFPSQMQKSF